MKNLSITILLTTKLLTPALLATTPHLIVGRDNHNLNNPLVQPQDPALSGGNRDQSQQNGDNLWGTSGPDVIFGGLGVDLLVGGDGDDVLAGGTEDFFPINRDKAFGGKDNDSFLWAPGDGSDFFDGGEGNSDTLILGLIGELIQGDERFQVETDQNFDKPIIRSNGLPVIDVLNSPGFCEVIDKKNTWDKNQLNALGLDHLVRFSIRNVRDDFEGGEQDEDNGLRVTISLKSTEYLVCASREGGDIEVLNLQKSPPSKARLEDLPLQTQKLLRSFEDNSEDIYNYQSKVHKSSYRNGNSQTNVNIYLDGSKGWFKNDWINGSFYQIKYRGNQASGLWKNQDSKGWFSFHFTSNHTFTGTWGLGSQVGYNSKGTWSSN